MSDLVHLFVVSVEGSSLCSKVIGLSSRLRRNRERWRLFYHSNRLWAVNEPQFPLKRQAELSTAPASYPDHFFLLSRGLGTRLSLCRRVSAKGRLGDGNQTASFKWVVPPLKLASWLGSFHLEKEPGCIQKYSSRSYLVRTSSRDFGCGSSSLWKIFM